MTAPVWLAAVGDATDPRTWSGTPYHCLQAGLAAKLFAGGLRLHSGGHFRWRRAFWNLQQLLTTGACGGYQYSDGFLDRLWRRDGRHDGHICLLNFFQLYPDAVMRRPELCRWFCIDQTLAQLFDYYGLGARVPAGVREGALARERAQYLTADGVICQSAWAAGSVGLDYGIPRDRIHVVLPGANLEPAAVSTWEAAAPDAPGERDPGPLRLVFVGREWKRKGLDRLIRAVAIARRRGVAVELLVLGVDRSRLPGDLARTPGVTCAGFIDKRADAAAFVRRVAQCDVGCLLSRSEAGGISLREFGRLGLPTIAPDTGGAPEYVVGEATHLVPPEAPDEAIADILATLAANPDLLARQRRAAWRARREPGWDRSVARIGAILGAAA